MLDLLLRRIFRRPQKTTTMAVPQARPIENLVIRFEGNFNVIERRGEDYERTRLLEGKVLSVSPMTKQYSAPAVAVKAQDVPGASLKIQVHSETEKVYFPREFSGVEVEAMFGSMVRYTERYTSIHEGKSGNIDSYAYKLEIVSGKSYGQSFERTVTI